MAASPAHRWGQLIGDVLEDAILPLLQSFAEKHGLYLDRQGERPCRSGKKCTWVDKNGNAHDLDFVLERGGTPDVVGTPIAFIETAWRRYTKHSRNKAQEIQGAIEPLAETFHNSSPFKGAVLAGEFTKGALNQLTSLGFTLLYFPYTDVVSVFLDFGIDASSLERTPVAEFSKKAKAYERLSPREKKRLAVALLDKRKGEVEEFMSSLSKAILRQIERIVIIALHGVSREVTSIDDAIAFIEGLRRGSEASSVERYEIEVRYNNGNTITGSFQDKEGAVEFLRTYQPASPRVL